MKLANRLMMIVDMLEDSDQTLADIACDHALLSIYIASKKQIKKIIASDINEQPLLSGKENSDKYCTYPQKVEFILSDGIKHINEKIDVAIIAGVGGALIKNILSHPNLANISSFIIQTNKGAEIVREFLTHNGFKITNESNLYFKKQYYQTIRFDRGSQQLSKEEILLGPFLIKNRNQDYLKYWTQRLVFLKKLIHKSDEASYILNILENKGDFNV